MYLIIDEGTTSCRAIIYNCDFEIVSIHQEKINVLLSQKDFVEQDALEIFDKMILCCKYAINKSNLDVNSIFSIGITNQRETIVAWQKSTGKPICNAIVWQDKRTIEDCEKDKINIGNDFIKSKTGLNFDPYFSASKMRWILNNIDKAKHLSLNSDLCIGTIDSFIVFNLTKGKSFITDHSNASRTNLYNLISKDWDDELLRYFNIPKEILPNIVDSSGQLAIIDKSILDSNISITSIIGDQQASLFGNKCFESGQTKNTFGTGSFLMTYIGDTPKLSKNGLLTSVAWSLKNEIFFAFEGSIFNAGTIINFFKQNLNILHNYNQLENIKDFADDEVFFVPAFNGLGAPHWDSSARGTILGINYNTTSEDILLAGLQSIAYQSKEIIDIINISFTDSKVLKMNIDGGISNSNNFCQILSDITQLEILKNINSETTSLGCAYLTALGSNNISLEQIKKHKTKTSIFYPQKTKEQISIKYNKWQKAVEKSRNWVF